MGFESKSARLARKYEQEKEALAAQLAEKETQLVSASVGHKKMQAELARLEAQNAKLAAARKAEVEERKAPPQTGARIEELIGDLRGIGEPIVTPGGHRGVRLKGDILFGSGKSKVNAAAKGSLARLADVIKRHDEVVVFVDGHTDSDPLRFTKKKYGNNYGLGAARANSVAQELVGLGVPREKLVTRSFGAERPIADNKSADGKKRNRRVEIIFALTNVARAAID
jgi:outer membrane protein OmpA-like peptidoglycan-associated protein